MKISGLFVATMVAFLSYIFYNIGKDEAYREAEEHGCLKKVDVVVYQSGNVSVISRKIQWVEK